MFFGGLVAGKSAAKKMKKYVLFFENFYFLRAGGGKISGKKTEKYKFYVF